MAVSTSPTAPAPSAMQAVGPAQPKAGGAAASDVLPPSMISSPSARGAPSRRRGRCPAAAGAAAQVLPARRAEGTEAAIPVGAGEELQLAEQDAAGHDATTGRSGGLLDDPPVHAVGRGQHAGRAAGERRATPVDPARQRGRRRARDRHDPEQPVQDELGDLGTDDRLERACSRQIT